jgi:hypothetical protein
MVWTESGAGTAVIQGIYDPTGIGQFTINAGGILLSDLPGFDSA